MKVYIAGPISGRENQNRDQFNLAEQELIVQGHETFNPSALPSKLSYRECMKVDLNWILDNAEAIALLEDWHTSPGAIAEFRLALALGLEVIHL